MGRTSGNVAHIPPAGMQCGLPRLLMGWGIVVQLRRLACDPAPSNNSPEETIAAIRDAHLFDATWYLDSYPDVAHAGVDPLCHYVLSGEKENRQPAPWFFPQFYAAEYPDVGKSGGNLFFHYIFHGSREGRRPGDFNLKARKIALLAADMAGCGSYNEAVEEYDKAMELAETLDFVADCLACQGECLQKQNKWESAAGKFAAARAIKPDAADVLARQGWCLLQLGKLPFAIEAYEKAVSIDDHKAQWLADLGLAYTRLEQWDNAANAMKKAIAIDGQWAEWHYHLGYAYERNGLLRQAERAYAAAIALDVTLDSAAYGIGVFHEQWNRWADALRAYEQWLQTHPDNAAVLASVARLRQMRLDFCGAAMANASIAALTLPGNGPQSSLRFNAFDNLGLCLERMGKLAEAESSYRAALQMRFDLKLQYRQGYVLAAMGRHKEACTAWQNMELGLNSFSVAKSDPPLSPSPVQIPQEEECSCNIDTANRDLIPAIASQFADACLIRISDNATDPHLHFLAGIWLEESGRLEEAAACYAASAARLSDHTPMVWYKLGRALASLGRHDEACEAYASVEILRRPYAKSKFYEQNNYFKLRANYLEFCETLPVAEDVIFYEHMDGLGVGDNPQGIFLEMLHSEDYAACTHVWSLENLADIPDELKTLPNVIFVRRQSDGWLRYLATARVLVNDVTFPAYFQRRPGQIYLNTWHGTPLKSLGSDVFEERMLYFHMTRNFIHCTRMVHPNAFTAQRMMAAYKLDKLYQGLYSITGAPRMDVSINMTGDRKEELKRSLGIAKDKKILLYAPTWRGNFRRENNVDTGISFIKAAMQACEVLGDNYTLLFRGHQIFLRHCKTLPELSRWIIAPQSYASNEIVALADVLVTDYSSIMFDFLGMGKPIILYAPDVEQYARERGFYLNPASLPFPFCQTVAELQKALQALQHWQANADYEKFRQYLCSHDDGKSSARALRTLTQSHTHPRPNGRKNVLFFGGGIMNGIGASLLALCNALAQSDKYNIFVMLDLGSLRQNDDNMVLMDELDASCTIIPCYILNSMTIEEKNYMDYDDSNRSPDGYSTNKIYADISRREFSRLFASAKFDVVIDFTGYGFLHTLLFACYAKEAKKIIMLHSDMLQEKQKRFPYLERIFNCYQYYDKLVSVSEAINEINKRNIAPRYHLAEDKFACCPNMQRPHHVRQAAQKALEPDDAAHFRTGRLTFINVARLSPEKNQKLLLAAFAQVHANYPHTRLLIVGHGPQEPELRECVFELGLEDCVFLTGFRRNPYPLMRHADCMVLPSIYEGQGIVLFEAMALNKPIIAIDVPTSREVLANGKYGLLTASTVAAFAAGMEAFLDGDVPPPDFDFDVYQRNALARFESLLE